ncbi:Uncharacterised protein [Mycobacterium tuberculosis]|nr:Uncharacterised protein [Mycobacterium tuberculosis]CKR30455.1 Uncharacterised protein [Mycobacterium tuberculosis]CKT21080.1 Uncharacterised protein [Mycobacterium tuberculosis]
MYRHPLGAHVVGWWKGVLMSFQHRQDGTAGALVAGDVDRDGSIDIAQRTAPAFPQRVRGGAALQDGKGPGQRLERDDAAREARAAQTPGVLPRIGPDIEHGTDPMRLQLAQEIAFPVQFGKVARHLDAVATQDVPSATGQPHCRTVPACSRYHATVASMPSRSAIEGRHPASRSTETSSSLRGVPSGLLGSQRVSPL